MPSLFSSPSRWSIVIALGAVAGAAFVINGQAQPTASTLPTTAPATLTLSPSLASSPANASAQNVATVPGMPAVVDALNLYSEIAKGKLSPNTAGALERVYVPNRGENTVSVIDPATLKVVDRKSVV